MTRKVKAAVAGASGYAGMTAVNLLARHPGVELSELTSRAFAGKPWSEVFPLLDLKGEFSPEPASDGLDVIFSCLPHNVGAAKIGAWLEAGLRVSRIMSLADDLAIALAVPSVRIVAPIPGKTTVGIEVPNDRRVMVRLNEVIATEDASPKKCKIQLFLGKLNGRLLRFPVPAGTSEGDRSVKEAVACGLSAMIQEHRTAIACFGEDTRDSTLERAAERIRLTRHKVECYAAYLAEEKGRLEEDLAAASAKLRAKGEELAAVR